MKQFVIIFLVVFVIASCKSTADVADAGSIYENYSEDLTSSLPDYPNFRDQLDQQKPIPVNSSQSIDDQLNSMSKSLVNEIEKTPYFNGFTVLVYSGVNRDEAFKAQEDLKLNYPEINHRMQYEQPRYLLKAGQYIYRIEAQKNYSEVKELFPTARIIRDKLLRKDFKIPQKESNAEGEN